MKHLKFFNSIWKKKLNKNKEIKKKLNFLYLFYHKIIIVGNNLKYNLDNLNYLIFSI